MSISGFIILVPLLCFQISIIKFFVCLFLTQMSVVYYISYPGQVILSLCVSESLRSMESTFSGSLKFCNFLCLFQQYSKPSGAEFEARYNPQK